VGPGLQSVQHGLIHDWIGGAFIAGVSIETVLATVRNYQMYPEFFKPTWSRQKALHGLKITTHSQCGGCRRCCS
jgi:hypothetical protein